LDTIVGKYWSKPKKGPVIIEDNYVVSDDSYLGAQECPFQNKEKDEKYYGYDYGASDIKIKRLDGGDEIVFNTLLPHMIRHHSFFEGPGISHRLDPSKVIQFFDLRAGIDYTPHYLHRLKWRLNESTYVGQSLLENLYRFRQIALKVYDITDKITGFLFPGKCLHNGYSKPIATYNSEDWQLDRKKFLIARYSRFEPVDQELLDMVDELVNDEQTNTNNYIVNGSLKGMYLAVFSPESSNTIRCTVEGMELEILGNNLTVFVCTEYTYLL
jgi:hypothetical protein